MLCYGLLLPVLAPGGLPVAQAHGLAQNFLAQADVLGCHLDQLIFIDEIDGLFQAHDDGRR